MADSSSQPLQISDMEQLFGRIIGIALGAAGIALFFLLVSGGFQLITSSGDPGKAAGAWKTITYAVAGLLVILLSILILRFIHTFTGVDLTIFKIVTE